MTKEIKHDGDKRHANIYIIVNTRAPSSCDISTLEHIYKHVSLAIRPTSLCNVKQYSQLHCNYTMFPPPLILL